jgi:hypothetical protein
LLPQWQHKLYFALVKARKTSVMVTETVLNNLIGVHALKHNPFVLKTSMVKKISPSALASLKKITAMAQETAEAHGALALKVKISVLRMATVMSKTIRFAPASLKQITAMVKETAEASGVLALKVKISVLGTATVMKTAMVKKISPSALASLKKITAMAQETAEVHGALALKVKISVL